MTMQRCGNNHMKWTFNTYQNKNNHTDRHTIAVEMLHNRMENAL